MKIVLFVFLGLLGSQSVVNSQSLNTDIYVANVLFAGKVPKIHSPKNITHRVGYDNQPYFCPDGNLLYYSASTPDSTMDIFQYDLDKDKLKQISKTKQGSEFSPRQDLAGGGLLSVRIEEDGVTQRIWRFTPKKHYVFIPWLDSVGYYHQINTNLFLTFILGSNDVHSLRLIDVKAQKEFLVDDSVGRCFTGRIFSDKDTNNLKLEVYYVVIGKESNELRKCIITKTPDKIIIDDVKSLGTTPGSSQDFVMVENVIMMASGNEIFYAEISSKQLSWKTTGFKLEGVKTITRLAYHSGTNRLAMVADDQQ